MRIELKTWRAASPMDYRPAGLKRGGTMSFPPTAHTAISLSNGCVAQRRSWCFGQGCGPVSSGCARRPTSRRTENKLVQAQLDGTLPPMPFNQIQCADLTSWRGNRKHRGWTKLVDGVSSVVSGAPP